MALSQPLQCGLCVNDLQKITLGIMLLKQIGDHLNDEVAHSTPIEVVDVAMAVIALGMQRKEQGFFGEAERAAVGKEPTDVGLVAAEATRSDEGGYFFDGVCHNAYL